MAEFRRAFDTVLLAKAIHMTKSSISVRKALPKGDTGRSGKLWPLLQSVYTMILEVKEDLPKWEPEESLARESG